MRDALIAALAFVEDAARRVQEGKPGAMTELRSDVRALDAAFRAHVTAEERVLLPALPREAAERLHARHDEERAMIHALVSDVEIDAKEPRLLAEDARWLARSLLGAHEPAPPRAERATP